VDRVLGAMFGLLRGVVLLLAATVVMEMTPLKSSVWWQEATGVAVSRGALHGIKPLLPGEFGKYLP
jgi:membrane protein required for colicin V production